MTAAVATDPKETGTKKQKRKGSWIVPLLLVLAGIVVMLYPVAATQYNNYHQKKFAQEYNSEVEKIDTSERDVELQRARDYNATLPGIPILDPYLPLVSGNPESDAYRTYESQLDLTEAMARVRVPSARIDLPIRHGTSDKIIAEGAGHLYGTSLPVGGTNTHAVITSHTGMADATLFDHLIDVKEGDYVFIDVLGETLAYQVDQIKVVLPTEIGDLKTIPGGDYITLFTCTPYAVNSHRLLVRAHRTDYVPPEVQKQAEQADSMFVWEDWMWWLVAGAAAGIIATVTIVALERRRRRRQREQAHDAMEPLPEQTPAAAYQPSTWTPTHAAISDDSSPGPDEFAAPPSRAAVDEPVDQPTPEPAAEEAEPASAPSRAAAEEAAQTLVNPAPSRAAVDDAQQEAESEPAPSRAATEATEPVTDEPAQPDPPEDQEPPSPFAPPPGYFR